jgi:hypothetical protein
MQYFRFAVIKVRIRKGHYVRSGVAKYEALNMQSIVWAAGDPVVGDEV